LPLFAFRRLTCGFLMPRTVVAVRIASYSLGTESTLFRIPGLSSALHSPPSRDSSWTFYGLEEVPA